MVYLTEWHIQLPQFYNSRTGRDTIYVISNCRSIKVFYLIFIHRHPLRGLVIGLNPFGTKINTSMPD